MNQHPFIRYCVFIRIIFWQLYWTDTNYFFPNQLFHSLSAYIWWSNLWTQLYVCKNQAMFINFFDFSFFSFVAFHGFSLLFDAFISWLLRFCNFCFIAFWCFRCLLLHKQTSSITPLLTHVWYWTQYTGRLSLLSTQIINTLLFYLHNCVIVYLCAYSCTLETDPMRYYQIIFLVQKLELKRWRLKTRGGSWCCKIRVEKAKVESQREEVEVAKT